MKFIYVSILMILLSCSESTNSVNKNKVANDDTLKNAIADTTIKFLWRDSSGTMIINEAFCKTISDPEKAALGFVATFIGSECWWDGDYTENRSNLKCEILTALDLGYQCSDMHLGFLKQWFRNDTTSLKKLEACPTTPHTATVQDTFEEITLITKGNEISIFFKATGMNMREAKSWHWSETNYFQFGADDIKMIRQERSEIIEEHFDGRGK